MSLERNIYQIVILIDIKNLRNDASYRRHVVLSTLKLLTFYSARARSEHRQLQWGFTFFDQSSLFSKALPSCKFRDFDVRNFDEFESLLERLSTARDVKAASDSDACAGCFDRFCECKRNAPALVLARCFTEVLTAFPWDSPDISSPVKTTPLQRLNDCSVPTINGHKRRITRNSSHLEERQANTNVILFFSKCPLSMTDLEWFTLNKRLDNSRLLLQEIVPSGIRKDFRHEKKIDLFWIDTHSKICASDISGMCLLAEAISAVGKLLTLQVLFGTKDLNSLMLINNTCSRDNIDDVPGKRLPDSATFNHYLMTPSTQCLYNKEEAHGSIILCDSGDHQITELCAELITRSSADEIPVPVKIKLFGVLSFCGIPLASVESEPVFGIRESSVSEDSVWSQLLTLLAKKHMVLVGENYCLGEAVPRVCLLQALTSISASLTYLKYDTVMNLQKRFTFQSSELALEQISDFVNRPDLAIFSNDSQHSGCIPRRPHGIDKFDPDLLEQWLLPKAVPSSLSTFLETINSSDLDAEDVKLLEQLQRTYMYQKSKRLTDVASTNKKVTLSPKRRSPRKRFEQQTVRRSPRKAVRTRAALLARGPGSNQSLPELELHSRSSTAPTRVDLIMQKSKQARYHSSDDLEKKSDRKSADATTEQKQEEPDFHVSSEEELFDHITNLHSEALRGQRTPPSAMLRVTALLASFTNQNNKFAPDELLKKSVWLSTAEVSKKLIQHTHQEKVREFECQLVLWMEAISRGWLKDRDKQDEATDEVVMILRRLSFLQDPGALNIHLSDLLARYGDSQPSVLYTVYKELGHPLPSQLEGLFSSDDLDMTLDSQAPDSTLSFVDSVQRYSTRLQSNRQGARKVIRHTSFHVVPQRQIKVAIPNKEKDKISRRRSARIASTSKVKPEQKNVDGTDTKQVRRNLFSGCGAKLERSQSVVSMETEGLHKSDTSHSKQKQKAHHHHHHHHRRSLVTETPSHKQKPNQTWQRQERWRRRTHTATADVTVVQESPDKKTVDVGKGSSQSAGTANFVRRASFYSGAPDKISRAIQKCEMLEARMTKRLLSPSIKRLGSTSLTALTPRRRIQPTTLFSKLLDPSPCKPKPCGMLSPTRSTKAEVMTQRHTDFSSPSRNTRGRMRLFQSPSPKYLSPTAKSVASTNRDGLNKSCSQVSFMSPVKNVLALSCFDSPSKNTRFQSRLESICQDRAVSSSNQKFFQTPPSGSVSQMGKQALSLSTPTKIQHLFHEPSTENVNTPKKAALPCPATGTPNKQLNHSPSCGQGTPTRSQKRTHSLTTPRTTSISITDFSSPSKNTRSQSKVFQPIILDSPVRSNMSECDGSRMNMNATTVPSSAPGLQSDGGFLSSVMTSSLGNDVKIFTSAVFSNSMAGRNKTSNTSSRMLLPCEATSLILTPSKSTRSQTQLFPGLLTDSSSGLSIQTLTTSVPSTMEPSCVSTISQRLFSSPAKQEFAPLAEVRCDNHVDNVRASPLFSPSQRKSGDSSRKLANVHPRKRKLSFVSSPDKCQSSARKRQRSSQVSSLGSGAAVSSNDYFDGGEVFIEKSSPRTCHDVLTSGSSNTDKLCLPLPNPSVEQLRHESMGSDVPSPVFCGQERTLSDQSHPSPVSPMFESATLQRQNKENRSDVVAGGGLRSAVGHFSPQLTRGSISHLVTSPLLTPSKCGGRQCRGRVSSPDTQPSCTSRAVHETSANIGNESRAVDQCGNKLTPKSCRKSFCRMPTKLSL